MRALFISNTFPADPRTSVYGAFNRMSLMLEAVKSLSDELELFFFAPPGEELPSQTRALEATIAERWAPRAKVTVAPRSLPLTSRSFTAAYFSGLFEFTRLSHVFHAYFQTTGPDQIAALESCLDRQPDWIFAHRLGAMAPLLLTRRALPPIIFDLDDVEHRSFMSQLGIQPYWHGKLLCYLHVPSIMRGERRAVRKARVTFVCSSGDRDYLRRFCGTQAVDVIPNSVVVPAVPPELVNEPTLVFIGSMTYLPNCDASDFLIESIWPLIRSVVPKASLLIVGAKPEQTRNYGKAVPGVSFTGFVADLAALYRRLRVVCCPIRAGGGTRIKIIEAAAYGKPVVATRIAASGLDFRDGEDILLRDSPSEFAAACVTLLTSDDKCRALGAAARRTATRLYDRATIAAVAKERVGAALPELYGSRDGSNRVSRP
jgi:glycosyltransferase involved in cell wall biosynthesis